MEVGRGGREEKASDSILSIWHSHIFFPLQQRVDDDEKDGLIQISLLLLVSGGGAAAAKAEEDVGDYASSSPPCHLGVSTGSAAVCSMAPSQFVSH